jgi:hypothetical protein
VRARFGQFLERALPKTFDRFFAQTIEIMIPDYGK